MSASVSSIEFKTQADRMFSNWSSSVNDPGVARTKKAELLRIFERVGAKRFAAGVEAALRNHYNGFFPTVAEFEAFIPSYVGQVQRETCEACNELASGWAGYRKQPCLTKNGSQYIAYKKCDHGERTDYHDR